MDLSNSSTQVSTESYAGLVHVVRVLVVCFVAFTALAGNLANVVILVSTPLLRNCHGCLLVSLAVADVGIGLVAALAIYPVANGSWPYGQTCCQLVAFAQSLFLNASSFGVTLLSVERYIAVVHPFTYSRLATPKNAIGGTIGVCWLTPAVCFGLYIFGGTNYYFDNTVLVCAPYYQQGSIYLLIFVGVFFLPCVFIIGVTSVRVYRSLSTNVRERQSAVAFPPSEGRPPVTKGAVRMFRITRVVAFSFYVFWVPYIIVGMGYYLAGKPASPDLLFFLFWFHVSGGFYNFIIYFAMNKTFRSRAAQLVNSCMSLCKN